MGAITILLLPIYPIVYLFFTFATMFGTATGADVTEVTLPYDESQGIVWTCERTDYGWFDLKDIKIEDNEQIFVFKGRNMFNCESDRRFSEIIFTDKNGNELIYYAKEAVPFIMGVIEVKMYAPGEYIIAEYTPDAKTKVENACWRLSSSESYCVEKIETEGVQTFRHVCFNDKETSLTYYYEGKDDHMDYERIAVSFKYTEDSLQTVETHQIKTIDGWVDLE